MIMSQINPVHTFVTHLFKIPCKVIWSSYCTGRYWILILNLKTWKDLRWQYHALVL
jgi:hypothetical protein